MSNAGDAIIPRWTQAIAAASAAMTSATSAGTSFPMAPGFERRGEGKAGHGPCARATVPFRSLRTAQSIGITNNNNTCRSRYARQILDLSRHQCCSYGLRVRFLNSLRCRALLIYPFLFPTKFPTGTMAKGDRKSVPTIRALIGCALSTGSFDWQRSGHSSAFLLAGWYSRSGPRLPRHTSPQRDTFLSNNGCSGERTDPSVAHRHRPSSRRVPACVATPRLGAMTAR